MRFGDILRLCRQNLWRRKSRTILTVLGVIVGCCSIVLMVSLGQGINEQNEKMLKSMGDLSIVTVYTNGYAGPMGGGGSSEMGDTKLDDKAVESFRAMSGVSGVTPMMNFPYNVTARAGAGGVGVVELIGLLVDGLFQAILEVAGNDDAGIGGGDDKAADITQLLAIGGDLAVLVQRVVHAVGGEVALPCRHGGQGSQLDVKAELRRTVGLVDKVAAGRKFAQNRRSYAKTSTRPRSGGSTARVR